MLAKNASSHHRIPTSTKKSTARHGHVITHIQCTAASSTQYAAPTIPQITTSPNILILGGTGRVGSGTAAALIGSIPTANVSIGSRTAETYNATIVRRPELCAATYRQLNIDDPSSLLSSLSGIDLVIHTAGPFQRRQDCNVLEAAIAAGVPYLDVCDDTAYSQRAKTLHERAKSQGVPAITTAGIYPGVSNVMAAHMISMARKEYDDSFNYIVTDGDDDATTTVQPDRVLYSYYTAGSGGAGPTILNTTFLLAGEDVVAYKDGTAVTLPPVSNRRVVDFGPGIGRKGVFLYSLPEVASGHQIFNVPNISARFGTDPDLWNVAMWCLARLVPKSVLKDRNAVGAIAKLADPLVRWVDGFVGEKVGMLVEVELSDGKVAAGLFVHNTLSQSVGICTAAFARSMLAGGTQPGVWFPEERGALGDRRALLAMASEGCSRFVLNKPPWAIESDPVQIGLGFYW